MDDHSVQSAKDSKVSGENAKRRFSLRNLRTISSLKNPVFRLYFIGIMGQRAAMNMQMIARSLLVYRLTDSGTILGLLSLFHALPVLFLSIFGGVLADRIHKKYVLFIGLGVSAMLSLTVALTLTFGYLSVENAGSWWVLAVEALVQGTIMGLMIPSRQAIIPEIVDTEQIMNAVSLDSTGMNLLRLGAPALSGFLIEAFDFDVVYYVMAGMYFFGTICMAFLPLTRKVERVASNALQDIKEGFKYVKQHTTILLVLIFTLFVVVLSMPYMTLLPIFCDDILKVGADGMGLLISVSGIGALTVSLVLASLPNKKRGIMLLISAVILGIALVGFSFSEIWWLSLVIIVFVGMGQAGRMALGNTLVQYYVDPQYRGRVMSIYVMEFGLTSFGSFGAGILADAVGAQWSLGGFAIALVGFALVALVFASRIRKLD